MGLVHPLFKISQKQAFLVYGGGILGTVLAFNILSRGLSSYTPKSTNSGEWSALTDKYMRAQEMNPVSLGYTPNYLKKKAE